MAGGTSQIRPSLNPLSSNEGAELKSPSSSGDKLFQAILEKVGSPKDLKTSFASLSRVLQTNDPSYGKRVESFRQIAEKIIASPTHPYSRIEGEVRSDMINSVADVMARSSLKVPQGMV